MKLLELRALLKDNKLRGYTHYNKPQLIELLRTKDLPVEQPKQKPEKIYKEIDSRYEYLRLIRNQPKSVEVTDLETGVVTTYPSMYKASRALETNPGFITFYDGRTFKDGKHSIKVL